MKLEITFVGLCAYLFTQNAVPEEQYQNADAMTVVMLQGAVVGRDTLRHQAMLKCRLENIGGAGTGPVEILLQRDWELQTSGPGLSVITGRKTNVTPRSDLEAEDIGWLASLKCMNGPRLNPEVLGADPYRVDSPWRGIVQSRFTVRNGLVRSFFPAIPFHSTLEDTFDFRRPSSNDTTCTQAIAEGVTVTLDVDAAVIRSDSTTITLTPHQGDVVRLAISNEPVVPARARGVLHHWAAFYNITDTANSAVNRRYRPEQRRSQVLGSNNRCPGVSGP